MRKKNVIAAIRRRHADRQPLNLGAVKREQPALVDAVYAAKPYWGWKQALADAGLTYGKIRIEVRESVQCELCSKFFQALPSHLIKMHEVDPDDYLEMYPGAELISESTRESMTGPHIEPHADRLPHWEPFLTKEYVLDRVNEYARLGYWMELTTMVQIDPALISAAQNYVQVSWDEVLRMVGLDPIEFRGCGRPEDFTLEDLREYLEQRRAAGLSCTKSTLFAILDEHHRRPRIVVWAIQKYGSWSAVLNAAGVDRSDPIFGSDWFLTEESVTAELQRLADELTDVSQRTVSLLPYGTQLTGAAIRYFGSWEAALNAAEIPETMRRRNASYDTADEVIAAIQERFGHGFSVAPLDLYFGSRSDIQLWKAAFQHFTSWRAAVGKAGGSATQIKQASETPFGTRAKVLGELRERSEEITDLAVTRLTSEPKDKHLYAMASGFFGGWQSAVRAIGVDPKSYHQKNLNPQRKYLEQKSLIDEIQRRDRVGEPLHTRGLTHGEYTDAPLLYTARKMFGDWSSAIAAAGLDYSKYVRKNQDYDALRDRVYQTYETEQEIVVEIQRRQKENLPLNSRALTHGSDGHARDYALLKAAKEIFKTWEKALTQAGIDVESIRPAWVTQRAKRLRQKQRAANKPPTS